MASLDDYFALAQGIKDFYEAKEGLQRKPGEFQIPEMANWLYHGIEEGHDLAWIRQAIRNDAGGEWRSKHPGESPVSPSPQEPQEPPPRAPLPPAPAVERIRLFQVTFDADGPVAPRTYSYWSNAWVEGETIWVFCGLRDGPAFFGVNRRNSQVERKGRWQISYGGETEGWYWDQAGWIYMAVGARLLRVHPATGEEQQVADISAMYPGCDLWQPHSSLDGTTHSATVRRIVQDGSYPKIATVVLRPGQIDPYPAHGDLDESQISPDATDVVIKETLEDGLSNRIIGVVSKETRLIRKAEGAVGHSDLGPGYLIGEWSPPSGSSEHGQCVRWDLAGPLVPSRRRELFASWNVGHLSYAAGRWIHTDASRISLLDPDSGAQTPLLDHLMVVTDPDPNKAYDFQTGANLDPSGTVVCFRANQGGPTQHLFVLDLDPLS